MKLKNVNASLMHLDAPDEQMLQNSRAGGNGEPSDLMVGEKLHGWGLYQPVQEKCVPVDPRPVGIIA